jgi:hypothetical protein
LTTIQTVEQATQAAMEFARKYYTYVFPVSTRRVNSQWVVDLDISYWRTNFVRLKIQVETGIIDEFKVTQAQLL